MDGFAAGGLRRRHSLRIAGLVVSGAVLVVVVSAGVLYLWLRSYAPLAALDAGYAPGAGVGADVEPVVGSGGRPVFFPAVRRGSTFDAAFTVRNSGRFVVRIEGISRETPGPPPWLGPVRLYATQSATASADPDEEVPFEPVRLAHDDSAILVLRYRLDCPSPAARSRDVFSDRVRLRISYLSIFHRTQTVALPFAVTLRCAGGPPATP
jgi:hypothetical protein